MVSLPRCGSLWAFGPSAHRAHASLRALPGFGADSRSLNRRGGRRPRPPLVSLPRKYRRSARCPRAALVFAHAFGSLCRLWRQQPTGLTLPSGAPAGRFALCATAHRADASLRRAHGFAVLANIGVLRAGRAQPLYLLTPAGRFALRATAHRADASLRRAHGFAALANIGVLRAGRAQPLYLLTPSGRFAQQPTGLTLPSGAPSPVPQHKKASVASARRAQETRLAQPLPEYQRKRRGHPPPGGAAPLLFRKHYHWKDPRFSRPFGRSQRSTGFAAGSAGVLPRLPASSRVSCVPVAQSFALP